MEDPSETGPGKYAKEDERGGQGVGYLTTKLSCLMSVVDAVWNVLKEFRERVRETEA